MEIAGHHREAEGAVGVHLKQAVQVLGPQRPVLAQAIVELEGGAEGLVAFLRSEGYRIEGGR